MPASLHSSPHTGLQSLFIDRNGLLLHPDPKAGGVEDCDLIIAAPPGFFASQDLADLSINILLANNSPDMGGR